MESIRTGEGGDIHPAATTDTAWQPRLPGSEALPVPPVLVSSAAANAVDGIVATFLTGASPESESAVISLRPESTGATPQLPVLLSRTAAEGTDSVVGSTLSMQVGSLQTEVIVVGMVDAVPTIDPSVPAVVTDLQSLAAELFRSDAGDAAPTEWLLSVDGTADPAVRLLGDPRLALDVVDRAALEDSLLRDPLGVGIQGALLLAFVAAAAFAAIGFAVDAIVAIRERRTEFALLRALGTATRQLGAFLAVEQAFLVGLGIAAGLAIGVLVAQLVLPFVSITSDASTPVPDVVVVVPWLALAALAAGMAILLAAVVFLASQQVRRLGVAGTLRLDEDR